LGSIDRAFHCASCGEDAQNCQGHFGHIELAAPVFHPGSFDLIHHLIWLTRLLGFMRKIQKLLEIVCHNCGKILSDEVRLHLP
jgi:DNA-directed RNA polymerase II subunit RPB1